MIPTFAATSTLAGIASWRIVQRLLQGDIIAWSIVAGIITVILLCIITWKLMQRGQRK